MGVRQFPNALLAVELWHEALGSCVAPGCHQRLVQRVRPRYSELHPGSAPTAPSPLYGLKDVRFGPNEKRLLLRGQLDHAPGFIRIGERREDFTAHAKVRMAH